MPAVGGTIEEVSINFRIFTPAADVDSNRKLGGFENELQANGNGTARMIKTRVTWMLDSLVLELDDARGDQEFLQAIADLNDFVDIDITYASGQVYQGSGIVSGELQGSSQNTTGSLTLSGPGNLTRQ